MSKLVWDEIGEHYYETGTKQGVLYVQNDLGKYPKGVAWNGLRSIEENPSGAEATSLYADDTKYLTLYSVEEFGATIGAYTYPEEFEECDGSKELATGVVVGQQTRRAFGLAYRTAVGNDIQGDAFGYKLHLLYGCKASPSGKSYSTINDSPEAIEFSWEITTTPVSVAGMNPTANLVIDSTKVNDESKMAAIEAILYGVDAPDFDATKTYTVGQYVTHETKVYKCIVAIEQPAAWNESDWSEVENPGPRLPLPDEVKAIFEA